MTKQPRDSIKIGSTRFDLGTLGSMMDIRAVVVVSRTRFVVGCERCKSVCVGGAKDCMCCEHAIRSRVRPDDGKHHIVLMSRAEYVARVDAFMDRMVA